jgi:SAM-dependent methyltransferase
MLEKIPWPFSRLYDRYPNRIFVKWFKRIAIDIKDKKISGNILDIGTGPGRLPIEIAKQNAEEAGLGDRVKFKVGSVYDTGFGDCSIDLVINTGLIHHLKEPAKAFNSICKILLSWRVLSLCLKHNLIAFS